MVKFSKDKLIRVFNPYYDWWEKDAPAELSKETSKATKAKKAEKVVNAGNDFNADMLISLNKNPMELITRSNPFHAIKKLQVLPQEEEIWYYHSKVWHMVLAKLEPKQGYRFESKHRSNTKRKGLKPYIYPIQKQPYDRTHLIPFGYHGNEDDSRLLVGWNSKQNQQDLNHFELKQKKRPYAIYWLCAIKRLENGAQWNYRIFKADTMEQVDKLTIEYHKPFHWDG